jgi:dolichol kinase
MAERPSVIDKSYISWKGELCRKGIHLASLSIPAGFFIFNPGVVKACLIVAATISLIFDLARIFGDGFTKKFLDSVFGFIIRPREEKRLSGSTTILAAALAVYFIYDLKIAAASMTIIVIGDTAAAIIGRRFGRIKFKNKSLEGTLAFVVFSSLGVYLIPDLAFQIGFIGAIIGAFIEALPVPIDDNITVPLIAGGAMQLLVHFKIMM